MNFEPQIHTESEELAQKLLELIPELFSKTIDWTKMQRCEQRPDESIPDYYGRFFFFLNFEAKFWLDT